MVVCKFFLQGTCKFGNNCRYEHQLDNYTYQNQNSTSILRQPHYTNTNRNTSGFSTQQTPNVDVNALVSVVVNDVTLAENGGQWKLSCYGPFNEKPAFPNFQDYSFEEIRLWFYEARKNNQLQQFQTEWMRLLNEANMRINALKNPTQDIINTIIALYNAKIPPQENLSGKSTFSFTLQPNEQQFFKQNQFISNSNENRSPFHQQSGSIFAQQQPSVFNNPQNVVNSNQNMFANNFQQQTQSIFTQNQPNSNSIFNNQQQIAQNQPIFNNQQQNNQNPQSIFNNQVQNTQNIETDRGIYSKLEDLTESELKWFQSDDLTVEKIPEKPPTFEMCFKT